MALYPKVTILYDPDTTLTRPVRLWLSRTPTENSLTDPKTIQYNNTIQLMDVAEAATIGVSGHVWTGKERT